MPKSPKINVSQKICSETEKNVKISMYFFTFLLFYDLYLISEWYRYFSSYLFKFDETNEGFYNKNKY